MVHPNFEATMTAGVRHLTIKEAAAIPFQHQLMTAFAYVWPHHPKRFWHKGCNAEVTLHTETKGWGLAWSIPEQTKCQI